MTGVASFDLRGILSYQAAAGALTGVQMQRTLRQALRKAGDKTRTQVRRALRLQTNVKAAKDVNDRTRGFLVSGELIYRITAERKALPIERVRGLSVVAGPGGGVQAAPWNVLRQFQRSFVEHGRYVARLGPARYPLRRLYGPSIAKELVKDQSLAVFERTALPELEVQVVKAIEYAVSRR